MANWYVSKAAAGANNGASWTNAWTDLDQIVWASIQPGDVINIDGGDTACSNLQQGYDFVNHATARPGLTQGMLYTGALVPTVSGTAANPITIRKSSETGRNGTVVIFGGRQTLLPELKQASYAPTGTGRARGIDVRNRTDIIIDGVTRSGIVVYGVGQLKSVNATATGWDAGGSNRCKLINVEIFDCGVYESVTFADTSVGFKTDEQGVVPGLNSTVDRCLIHDCGQDALQGEADPSGTQYLNSAFYFRRFHSNQVAFKGYPFNTGSQSSDALYPHVDALQHFAGGLNKGPLTMKFCWLGPGVNQGFYAGDGALTSFDNVLIEDTTIVAPHSHGVQGDNASGSTPANWTLRRLTIHGPSTRFTGYTGGWLAVEIESGTGHQIQDSIIGIGADFVVTAGFTGTNSGNIYYGTGATAVPGGTNVDPNFVNPLASTENDALWARYAALNLTPQATQALGKGSPLVSFQTLLDRIDSLNGPGIPPAPLPTVTTDSLRSQVRAISDVDINDVSDAEIDTYLNDSYQEVLGENPWPFLMKRAVFTPTANQAEYPISSIASDIDVHRIQYVMSLGVALDQLEPFYYFQYEPYGLATPTTATNPTHWTVLDGNKLALWPAPQGTDQIQVVYLATPPDFSSDTAFPAQYRYVLKWGALRYVYQKIGDMENATFAAQNFLAGVKAMRDELSNANSRPLVVMGSQSFPRPRFSRLRYPWE
jgi:hypothetical protein